MQSCTNIQTEEPHYIPAMAYVPWQNFTSAYDPEKAFLVGTIFPELDKPFLSKKGGCK